MNPGLRWLEVVQASREASKTEFRPQGSPDRLHRDTTLRGGFLLPMTNIDRILPMTDIPRSLYDTRKLYWELMKAAFEQEDWCTYEDAYKKVNQLDNTISSYNTLPNASIEPVVTVNRDPKPWVMPRMDWELIAESHRKATEITPLGSDNPQFMYSSPARTAYDSDRHYGSARPKITNTVHYNGLLNAYVEDTPDRCTKEAELYFEVTNRKRTYTVGFDTFHYSEWGYVEWRKEYTETGQSFAFDKMIELYDPRNKYVPDEPQKSEVKRPNWMRDTPFFWILMAMVPIVLCVLCMAL